MRKFFERIFGFCPYCHRWFQYSTKRRRQSTAYIHEEDNYIVCCDDCFEEVEAYWKERWDELDHDLMSGLNLQRW